MTHSQKAHESVGQLGQLTGIYLDALHHAENTNPKLRRGVALASTSALIFGSGSTLYGLKESFTSVPEYLMAGGFLLSLGIAITLGKRIRDNNVKVGDAWAEGYLKLLDTQDLLRLENKSIE